MADIKEIAALLERATRLTGTPSISVGIVQDGKVIYSSAGYKDVKNQLKPDKDTLYAIGSASKAFTAAALAMLADEGKIEFDKPVKSYIPEFEMYDPYVTANLTVGDTLCHRCGLPRHEFMWYLNLANYSLKDVMDRLKYLKPNKPFRTDMQYQNHMFMVAGYLIERVSGQTWGQFVHDRIFVPLGMNDSSCNEAGYMSYPNKAIPYYVDENKNPVEIPFKKIDDVGAAGAINSTASDMLKWLQLNLNKGKIGDKQLISEANFARCHRPQMPITAFEGPKFDEIDLQSYGYGWFLETYKGVKVVQHGGSIDGFIAGATFIPSINTGVIILTNHDSSVTASEIRYSLYDILLDRDRTDWVSRVEGEFEKINATGKKALAELLENVPANSKPTHAIENYAGAYENPAYGVYELVCENDILTMEKDGFNATFQHISYNNFMMKLAEERGLVVTCKFDYNGKGEIDRLIVNYEAEPIVFTKK